MACSQRAPFLGVNSYNLIRASQVVLGIRTLPASEGGTGDMDWIPGREDPLEEGPATHSSILAWRIPWTERAWRATVHGVADSQKGLRVA